MLGKPVVEFKIVRQSVNIAPRRLPTAPKTIPRELRSPKDHQEHPRRAQEAPKSTQEAPKSERIKRCQPFGVDLAAQNCPQDSPKRTQEEPKRAPKRSQDHLRIENLNFSKIDECLS